MTNGQLPNYRWIKFGLDYLDDPDFMRLTDATTGIYTRIYLLAGRGDAGGLLCNGRKVFSEKDLSLILRLDQGILQTALTELIGAGFVTRDGEGYRITRFRDEQGPGDNGKREEWAERQRKHRAKVASEDLESDSVEDSELRLRKDIEEEEEGRGDITVTDGDVTVTNPLPFESPFLNTTLLFNEFTKQGYDIEAFRVEESVRFCTALALLKGWNPRNEKFVLELCAPGVLEERKLREDYTEEMDGETGALIAKLSDYGYCSFEMDGTIKVVKKSSGEVVYFPDGKVIEFNFWESILAPAERGSAKAEVHAG
jgi:hypothetical protein